LNWYQIAEYQIAESILPNPILPTFVKNDTFIILFYYNFALLLIFAFTGKQSYYNRQYMYLFTQQLYIINRSKVTKKLYMTDHTFIIGFATSFATSAYHHQSCDFESRSWWGALDTTLHDKVCQLPVASGRWFSPKAQINVPWTFACFSYD
jgi:hypothetical protein